MIRIKQAKSDGYRSREKSFEMKRKHCSVRANQLRSKGHEFHELQANQYGIPQRLEPPSIQFRSILPHELVARRPQPEI
jgi:hypothetical protein